MLTLYDVDGSLVYTQTDARQLVATSTNSIDFPIKSTVSRDTGKNSLPMGRRENCGLCKLQYNIQAPLLVYTTC